MEVPSINFYNHSLASGFMEVLKSSRTDKRIGEITLLRLKVAASVGAASLGARDVGFTLPVDYSANAEKFFHDKF